MVLGVFLIVLVLASFVFFFFAYALAFIVTMIGRDLWRCLIRNLLQQLLELLVSSKLQKLIRFHLPTQKQGHQKLRAQR